MLWVFVNQTWRCDNKTRRRKHLVVELHEVIWFLYSRYKRLERIYPWTSRPDRKKNKTKQNKNNFMTYSNLSQIPSIVGIVVWLVIFRRLENYVVRQIFVSFFRSFRIKSAGPSFLSYNQFYLICVGITLALDHTYQILQFLFWIQLFSRLSTLKKFLKVKYFDRFDRCKFASKTALKQIAETQTA